MKHPAVHANRFCSTAITFLAVLALLDGCGTHSTLAPSASQQNPGLTGAWLFTDSGAHAVLAAALSTHAGVIAGAATAYGCSDTPQQTTVSGTVTSSGGVVFNTGRLSGGEVLELRGKLGADRKSVEGRLTAVGAKCSPVLADGGIAGHVYAPAHGSYTGIFTGSDGASTPVTAVLSQAVVAGPGGSYTLNGSVAFPGSLCLSAATVDAAQSTVTGGALSAAYTAVVDGRKITIEASGTTDPSAAHIAITRWAIMGGSCDGYSGTGVLDLRRSIREHSHVHRQKSALEHNTSVARQSSGRQHLL